MVNDPKRPSFVFVTHLVLPCTLHNTSCMCASNHTAGLLYILQQTCPWKPGLVTEKEKTNSTCFWKTALQTFYSIKRGVILTFYIFYSNGEPKNAFYCCEMCKKSKSRDPPFYTIKFVDHV